MQRLLLLRALLVGASVLASGGSAWAQAAKPAAAPAATVTPPAPAPAPASTTAQPAPAASATNTPAPPPVGTDAAAQAAAAQANTVKLHDLERRVDELKEQVFRSKARLNLLKETVLHGVIAGARTIVYHRNEMGSLYLPIRYVYALDGTEVFSGTDNDGKLSKQKEFEVFSGSIAPGNHTLSVQMVYQGSAAIFTYFKGYKFTAKSSHTFTASEGKQLQLKVVGFEKGNPITTDPKDRPAIDFRETVVADKDASAKEAAGKAASAATKGK